MSGTSAIEWTESTWNPVTGCTEVSPGCDHCYARTFAERFRGTPGHVYEQGFDLKLWPERLSLPLTWRKPRRVFVNSMSDLFHKDVPNEFIARVFGNMHSARQHTFQVLTKRPDRMRQFIAWFQREWLQDFASAWPREYQHVWLGVSVESADYTWRIDKLRETPAAVRFLSCEPLLGPLPNLNLDGIDWVIIGGESGPGARRMDPDWAQDIFVACFNARVPVFFKQTGTVLARELGLKDRKGGDIDEYGWRHSHWKRREFPRAAMARAELPQ